ncbi:rhamnogalacturonan lyase [Sphingobacterium bovistauri]|uniref:Rhamnogalacturonan lyase n=1 Tax=Sphingobacterium bovistauri TaxID=2781959 RepID=A0ABS7Z0Z4_9SPHI|nr:rhamnogalacturonan lyase [Sphingobacterium bovistauri]MCA5003846.1 rhamnogalacturonan lyase [Sphingobacterium bovistauri]
MSGSLRYFSLSARLLTLLFGMLIFNAECVAQRKMEFLDRGLVGVKTSDTSVFLSWRLLGSDDYTIAFNLYRQYGDQKREKLNSSLLTEGTNFEDSKIKSEQEITYFLTVLDGKKEVEVGQFKIEKNQDVQSFLKLPLRTPIGYTPGDISVGDLDGDGNYELIVHQNGIGRDNAHNGLTSDPILQAYKLDGTLIWEINLGKNIREGAHYTQFMVYDLDGDGIAEIVCKTADGTKDGVGKYVGDVKADWRDTVRTSRFYGRILEGPEYLTVFDGRTGAAIHTVDYLPERGDLMSWGDRNANRGDRYLACVAYLDGKSPSVIMTRGYYERTALVAWDFKNKKLVRRWVFDTKDRTHPFSGQGYHNLSVADIDQDGKDEVIFGSMVVDDDGTGLYSTRLGHGDALHVSDFDPNRPGLEIFGIHELKGGRKGIGAALLDAKTGEIIFKGAIDQDVGRGVAANIDPNHKGAYMWWAGSGNLFNMKGESIGRAPRSANFLIWWDGDLSRELLNGNYIEKYNHGRVFTAEGAISINGSKSTPNLSADILGDWREELILRSSDNQSLRIYTTIIPTSHRLYTLMHDPHYRVSVAWQNVGYNQPPHTGYYLGTGMDKPNKPNIKIAPNRKK